jgi:O-antigen/teichoic acid export membrane protein
MAVHMGSGFVVAPFLVRHLGQTAYGLWILIASLTGYFSLLDLGVRGSVGRNIALHRANGDQKGVNSVLTTAVAILSGAGALALLGTFAILLVFFRVFDVPPGEEAATRLALVIVGVNLSLTLSLNIFDATLWGFQRFDLLNAIDIPAVLIRTALTFYLIGRGHGLVALALITLLTTAGAAVFKAVASFRVDRDLRIGRAYLRAATASKLYGYGIWYFLLSVARMVNNQIGPLIVGARLGVQAVTPYSIAVRLVGYAISILIAGSGVLTPVATALHAEDKQDRQRDLCIRGGRLCTALALFFLALFCFAGRPLVTLWMGEALSPATRLLAILALGEALPMSQWVSNSIVLGMGRHRTLACLSIIENALAIGLALALVGPYGNAGACLAFAVNATLFRGVGQLVYTCRVVGLTGRQYLALALLPPVAVAAPSAATLAALVHWVDPRSWPALISCVSAYVAVFCLILLIVEGYDITHIARVAVGRITGRRGVTPTGCEAPAVEG